MATTFVDYAGDGNNNKAFSFPSYQESDIKVEVDGVVKTTSTHYNITSYTTTGGGTVVFTAGNIPASGTDIRIYRDTDVDSAKATFAAGSSVKAADLNNNTTQLLYAIDEQKTQTLQTEDFKDNSITSAKILGNAVNSAHLADNSVGSSELQSDSVGTTQIKDNAVTSAKIAADAVGSAQIADGAVGASAIAADAVRAAQIQDGAVGSSEIAADAVGSAQIATNAVGSSEIADNAVDSAQIAADAIGSAQIADGAVDSAQIAADAVGAAQLADGAVGSAALAADSVGSAQISDGAVGSSEIAADAVGAAQIADGAVGSAALAADSVGAAQIADGAVGSAALAADSVGSAQIADGAVDAAQIAADAVRSAQIQDNAVGSSEIAASAVQNNQLANNAVSSDKITADAVGSAQLADGAVGSAALDANSVGNVQLKDNAVTMDEIGCEETTITDDDTKLPTSGAVVDYVSTQLAAVGGFETIATDAVFPNSQPASGIIVSVADAGGLVVNGSGVSTTGRTVGGSTVTINNINSQFNSTTVAAGVAFMVESTGSGHIYNYHKATLKEADLINLSSDIDDFGNRYRVASSAPGSDNDEGDLYFDTTANKMYVYDGSAWGQVTSTGEFKILGVKDNGEAHNGAGPTFNGSNDQYDLFESTSDASIDQASQLIVVLNGVVQKPNDGSWSGSNEGYHLDGADGIRFCDPPPSGSTLFVTKCGSGVSIPIPGDNTVTAAKTDISLVQGDIIYSNGTDSWTRLAKGTAGQVLKMNSGASAPEWGTDNNDNTQLTQEQVEDFVGGMLDGTETGITVSYDDTDGNIDFVVDDTTKLPLAGGTITGDVVFDNATNAGKDITWDMSDDALEFADSTKATFGASGDLQIYHDGTDSHIYHSTAYPYNDFKLRASADLRLQTNNTEDAVVCNVNGSVDLYYDNVKEFETKSGGVKLNGHSESVITALTSASSVTIDFSLSNHFSCTMGHNITFANPTTESVGQSGTIVLTQDGTGSRTASWGSQFLWAEGTAPTLSTAAAAVDRIDYFVAAADKIHCVASLGMA